MSTAGAILNLSLLLWVHFRTPNIFQWGEGGGGGGGSYQMTYKKKMKMAILYECAA